MPRTPRTAKVKKVAESPAISLDSPTNPKREKHRGVSDGGGIPRHLIPNAQAMPSTGTGCPASTLGMTHEARLAWNLKILKRHDPLIMRIFDQAPYAVLYSFNHANAHDPDGGKGRKYEGTWEKTGVEGTVFLIERSKAPLYGFFLLNRGGTNSIVQMFHPEDTIELGSDPRFLTFRPGEWDHAETPYVEPITQCPKPSLICLWMSDQTAGPRFSYFMTRAREHLARLAKDVTGSSSSPPLTPLSQIHHITDDEFDSEADEAPTFRQQQQKQQQKQFYRESEDAHRATAAAIANPFTPSSTASSIDQLFAALGPPTAAEVQGPSASVQISVSDLFAASHHQATSANITSVSQSTHSQSTLTSQPLPPFQALSMSRKSADDGDQNRLNGLLQSAFSPHHEHPALAHPQPSVPNPSPSLLGEMFAASTAASSEAQLDPQASSRELVTPPPKSRRAHRSYTLESSEDEVVLLPGRPQDSRSKTKRDSLDEVRSTRAEEAEYQELEAPSPSLIPNPLHTPAPALSLQYGEKRRNRNHRNRKSWKAKNLIGGGGLSDGHDVNQNESSARPTPLVDAFSASGSAPMIGIGLFSRNVTDVQQLAQNRGQNKAEAGNHLYVPQTTQDTELDQDILEEAILSDSRLSYLNANKASSGSGISSQGTSPPLSKYDFIRGLLSLIHKEPIFVESLYTKYQSLAKKQ